MSKQPVQVQPAVNNRRFFLSLVLTLIVMAALSWVGSPLSTKEAPSGIISYEFAGTLEKSSQILASWSVGVKLRAAFSLGLDYLFMPLYAATIGMACRWANGILARRRWPLASLGVQLAAGLWLAAGMDAVENFALTSLLFGSMNPLWPKAAFICAAVKFSLVFLGLVYAFLGLVVRWVIREPEL